MDMKKRRLIRQMYFLLSMLFLCGYSFAGINATAEKQASSISKAKSVYMVEVASNNDSEHLSNSQPVRGKIVDESNEPLIGVSVMVKGTQVGTLSDVDGNFEVNATPKSILVFSYLGFSTKEVVVGNDAVLTVVLQEDIQVLDEVVVIGYGAVKKKDLTGAVGVVSGADLAVKKTTQLSSALQGSVPGLMVRRTGGAPGAGAGSMHIRGVTSINDSSPLVIIDGIPGDIDQVNPNDVESISVLKDAASASIYGSRAAAGVILVTTKRANESDVSITYSGEFGLEIPTVQPGVVGVTRYLEMYNELLYNDNPAGGFYQAYSPDQVHNWMNYNATNPNQYPVTDWRKMILKDTAPRQTHSVHITGGSKNVRTKASLAYDKVDGLYADRFFQRYTLRVNNDFTFSKLLGASLDFNVKRSKHHEPIFNPFRSMRMTPSIYAAVWDDGRIAEGKSGGNPYGLLMLGGNEDKWYTQVGGKASLDFTPIKGLKVSGIVAPIINFNKFKAFKKAASYTLADDPNTVGGWLVDAANPYSSNKLSETRNDNYQVTSQVIANYMKTINNHSFSVMGGFENYYEKIENLSAARDFYELTEYPHLDVGPEDSRENSGSGAEYTYNSWFGRAMYNYANKYLLQANVRYDGSSHFHRDYRWGVFPSFSGGWVITEEAFFRELKQDWLSFLKLRASWGQIGNERIGNYAYEANMKFGNTMFYKGDELTSYKTAAQRELAYRDITWETTETTDIGIDLTFLNNRLRLTADYYWKSTKDMLMGGTWIPSFMGYTMKEVNKAKMSTKGFDIELAWSDKKGDWSYGGTFVFSDFISKVDYMAETDVISGNKIKRAGVGFNEWYGYVSDGIYQTHEDVDNSAKLNSNITVGDIKYKDVSGKDGVPDGVISPEFDRVPLGNSLPRFQYGGNVNVGYKDFDMSLSFNGVGKQLVRKEREMVESLRGNYGNIPDIIDGKYWSHFNTTSENANAQYPRLTHANRDYNYAMSDFWLFNGRYFRLTNITFGYTLPKALVSKANMRNVRVYASASDLFSISKYPSGWDPEMGATAYPITTSLVFGLSVNF